MNNKDDIKTPESTDLSTAYVNAISNISNALAGFREISKKITESFKPMFETMAAISQAITNTIPKNYLQGLVEVIQEVYNNPNSLINYSKYEQQLDNFHWAWPYDFKANEIKALVETVGDEKEFDDYMIEFFSDGKDSKLMESILAELPKRQHVIFKQIIRAYNRGDYVIANNALMSIIDNLLANYLYNPGQVRRQGLLHPIVDLWSSAFYNTAIAFRLMMLSHNVDFIFEEYNFAEKIVIKTNKKVRRHPAVHGFRYSNQKIDSLMLMNTLQELLSLKDVLKLFKNSLAIDKKTKTFKIHDDKSRAIFRPIIKDIIISSLEESEEGLSHEEILEELRFRLDNDSIVTSRYISGILQSMKKSPGQIYSFKEKGKTRWAFKKNGIQQL